MGCCQSCDSCRSVSCWLVCFRVDSLDCCHPCGARKMVSQPHFLLFEAVPHWTAAILVERGRWCLSHTFCCLKLCAVVNGCWTVFPVQKVVCTAPAAGIWYEASRQQAFDKNWPVVSRKSWIHFFKIFTLEVYIYAIRYFEQRVKAFICCCLFNRFTCIPDHKQAAMDFHVRICLPHSLFLELFIDWGHKPWITCKRLIWVFSHLCRFACLFLATRDRFTTCWETYSQQIAMKNRNLKMIQMNKEPE